MKIKEGLKIRFIADENVLIIQGNPGIDTTKVASFNDTANRLWDELYGKEFSLNDVAQLLISDFNIDSVTAESDAQKWIDQLSACNALEIGQ
jgi:hypothetical protein